MHIHAVWLINVQIFENKLHEETKEDLNKTKNTILNVHYNIFNRENTIKLLNNK